MAPNACTDEHQVISWDDKRRTCVDDMQRGAHEAEGLHPNINKDVDHEDDTSVVHGMRRTVNELESKMQGEHGKMKEPRLDEKLRIVGLNAEEKPMKMWLVVKYALFTKTFLKAVHLTALVTHNTDL